MATRDLIPEAFDNDDAQAMRAAIDELEIDFLRDPFEVPATAPVEAPVAPEPVVVAPPLAPPTIGSTFSQLLTLLADSVRGVRRGVDRKTAMKLVGQGVSIVGILLLALAVFEGFIGGITEQRDQRELRGAFDKLLTAQAGFAAVTKGGTQIIPVGTPVASIEIPKIGLRRIVAEGTTSDDLRKGPGHLRSTPLPGQHGNAVIAGRRTTYGGAFADLGKLRIGDQINVTTPFGAFHYLVHDVETLASGDPDRLGATMTDNLTLTTSDPPYRANKRLVVVGRLQGKASKYVDPLRQSKVDKVEGSFFGDAGKAWPALGYELLLFVVLIASRTLYNRWAKWPTYLISTPIVLAVAFAWLQAMVGLLPSTL